MRKLSCILDACIKSLNAICKLHDGASADEESDYDATNFFKDEARLLQQQSEKAAALRTLITGKVTEMFAPKPGKSLKANESSSLLAADDDPAKSPSSVSAQSASILSSERMIAEELSKSFQQYASKGLSSVLLGERKASGIGPEVFLSAEIFRDRSIQQGHAQLGSEVA